VGRCALTASLGAGLAADLGLAPARAEGPDRLTFGPQEPLVGLMQDTPADKLQPLLVSRIKDGTPLRELVAAAALANARTFGGEDYTGFHTLMALAPAFHMAEQMPAAEKALPVLKVIYRNSKRIQERGVEAGEVLHAVAPAKLPGRTPNGELLGEAVGKRNMPAVDRHPALVRCGELLREAVRKRDVAAAESTFAALLPPIDTATVGRPDDDSDPKRSQRLDAASDAFAALLVAVEDAVDVHRVVLPWRAWRLLHIVGFEHAHTLLRQSVRYCVKEESPRLVEHYAGIRALLPKLMDQYHLAASLPRSRPADAAWIEATADAIFRSTPDKAAEIAAGALADGIHPIAIGEAISLAANQLVLRDAGRPANQAGPGKPPGSVHGDSIGVHASDSANAWRGMAGFGIPRQIAACLICGAYQVARDRVERGGNFLEWKPRPWVEHKAAAAALPQDKLLREAEDAIRTNDQARACAVVARIGEVRDLWRPTFDLLLKFAVSEEGALHAEKYYQTVSEESRSAWGALGWRHVIALARVTASEYGTPAAGQAEARRLIGV
jgi:hypothetical protein